MKKKAFAIFVLLSFVSRVFGTSLVAKTSNDPLRASGEETSLREFDVGSRLGASLVEGCVVFIGTIRALGELEKGDNRTTEEILHRTVRVKIEEWIWNSKPNRASVAQLDQPLVPEPRRYGSEGRSPWDGVNVYVGNKLLVALRENEIGTREYGMITSDENLFPAIRNALIWHDRYLQNPAELSNVSDALNFRNESVFVSYFTSYLWRGGSFGNRDAEALALGGLLGRSRLPDRASALIRLTLTRLMLSEPDALMDATHRSLTETLVSVGAGSDLKRAGDAIVVLLRLGDKKKLEMAGYLTSERQRRLTDNYQTLVQKRAIEKGHAD